MATRMQQRRGTASQWTSANPVLNAGEMGWESDTNKFKMGDGTNHWADLDYFIDANSTVNPAFGTSIVFEGATADSYETTLAVTDPTADRTITFPDATGTVALTSDISVTASSTTTFSNKSISLGSNTVTSTLAQLNTAVSDADVASLAGSETLTNKTIALGSNTVSGTIAQFNTAVTDADLATLAGSETLTNKTLTSPAINTPTGITKTDVGLANVDNTTDANKPVSTATQTALDLKANLSGPTFTGTVSAASLTLSGDLTVNGTTTNINSTNLVVEDKNVILGDVATPSDTTADGGGITLKGLTDKTFNWVDATDSWTSSEHINLASGKSYSMNGTALKDVSETLSNKTLSSAIATTAFTLNATAELRLADTDSTHYVGFKSPGTVSANKVWTLPATDGSAGQTLSTNGSATLSWSTPAQGAAFSELMLIGA